MRLILLIAISLVVFACVSGKKTAEPAGKKKTSNELLLNRRIPVYVNLYRTKSTLSNMLIDSLRNIGFNITDSVNALKLFKAGMLAVMRPTDPNFVREISEKLKSDKEYISTLLNQSNPVYQYVYTIPDSSNEGYLWVGRQDPVRMTSRKFKIPYSDTERIEEFMSRTIDSLTGRR